MLKSYFILQAKLLHRQIEDVEIPSWLIYGLSVLIFLGGSTYLFAKVEFAPYIYVGMGVSFVSKLSETRRNIFLQTCFSDRMLKTVRIAENLSLTLPFLLFLLYEQYFLFTIALILISILLALVNLNTTLSFTLWTPFKRKPFEFAEGFRNTFYLIIAAYLLMGIALYVKNFGLGLFTLVLTFGITLSYYGTSEPVYHVWAYSLKPQQFLLKKISIAVYYSLFLTSPLFITLGLFFPEYLPIIAFVSVLGWGFLIGMISIKYTLYPEPPNILQSLLLGFCVLFPPLLLLIVPYAFRKSEKRLSSLLK